MGLWRRPGAVPAQMLLLLLSGINDSILLALVTVFVPGAVLQWHHVLSRCVTYLVVVFGAMSRPEGGEV